MKSSDVRTYKIRIHGQVKEEDISRTSPVWFRMEPMGETNTSLTLRTDQSGVIGLIRHLHGLGLVLISIKCSIKRRN